MCTNIGNRTYSTWTKISPNKIQHSKASLIEQHTVASQKRAKLKPGGAVRMNGGETVWFSVWAKNMCK